MYPQAFYDSTLNDFNFFQFPIICTYQEKYSWYLILTFILRSCLVLVLVASSFLIPWDYLGRCWHCEKSFTSSFPICIPFILCFCHLELSRTPSSVLNRSEVRGQPRLVLILRGKSNISPLRRMRALNFYIHALYLTEEVLFLIRLEFLS